jgi:SNF2 family DNA or RNA helicase
MKKKPYKHQIETTKFLLQNPKAFCWNAPGTGKTLSCLLAYKLLRKYGKKKALVVCTLSTVVDVWGKEFFGEFLTSTKWGYLLGSKEKRVAELKKNYDIYIINHDGIKTIFAELYAWSPDIIIVDEHTAFKNARSDRWKVLFHLCDDVDYVWMLSGTPCSQAPTDLFAPGRIVCPDVVGRSFIRFRDRVMTRVGMFKWIPKPNWENVTKQFPVIRFSREECLDLPPVTKSTLTVAMSSKQQSTFDILRKEALIYLEDREITAVNEGVMRMKLLQCCGGYVYSTSDESGVKAIIDLNPEGRLNTLKEIIEECGKGVIIFSTFSSSIDAVHKSVSKHWKSEIVDGSVTLKSRTEIFKAFQNGEIQVIVAHPKTMGHGVTLTYADTIIWYLVSSDAELYEQANGRINRIGQHNKMRVIHLISTKFEEKILERLEQKRSMQGLLLEFLEEKA